MKTKRGIRVTVGGWIDEAGDWLEGLGKVVKRANVIFVKLRDNYLSTLGADMSVLYATRRRKLRKLEPTL